MSTLIPCLVESLLKRKVEPVIRISELLLNFVAAYKDIPFQRRQDLFVSLTKTVGADDYLFALLILLLDKYPGEHSVVDFAAELAAQQDCRTQLIVSNVNSGASSRVRLISDARPLRNIWMS